MGHYFDKKQFNCQVDKKPCDIIVSSYRYLEEHIDRNSHEFTNLVKLISRFLPCQYCKGLIGKAQELNRTRLGRLERHILLTAPSSEKGLQIIEPTESGIYAQEAHLRAIRKLSSVGLIWKGRKKQLKLKTLSNDDFDVDTLIQELETPKGKKKSVSKTAISLSPLGEAVVKLLIKSLKSGEPIRWAKYKDQLVADVTYSLNELYAKFRANVKEHYKSIMVRYINLVKNSDQKKQKAIIFNDILQTLMPKNFS